MSNTTPSPSAPSSNGPSESSTSAQIFDQGYRRYTGPRTGVIGAEKSLITFSAKTALGMGRAARFKIVPVLIIISAFVPAGVFIGVAALFGEEIEGFGFLPTYAGYYGYVIAAIYLFAGFVAPELLSPDRRTGMLGMYLAAPLNRPTYLLGKAIAVVAMILIVTLGPTLLMLIAYSLEDIGPSGLWDWIATLGRVILSSLVFGSMFAAVGLAISATTDRSMIATATILAIFPASAIVTDLLVDVADLTPHLRLANLPNLPRDLVFRIHGERGLWATRDNPTWTLWAAWFGWMSISVSFIWFKYRRLLVRR